MPILPSGRRIEFSLDRFHAMLLRMPVPQAREIAANLEEADDLLFVMDVVHFGREDGSPFLAGCVASEWTTYAADWTLADRQALLAWFESSEARERRAEAIDYIRSLFLRGASGAVAYPYAVLTDAVATAEGSSLLQ